ncbi:MAG: HisA/HisF-related TIM barrel protein [Chloroflexota bacterium]|nr:HisA/HisF-related TIM barrel protein [Chloroflexota bacterium]
MVIYPAIDLRNGRCVRLRQGDPNAETVFGEDPAAIARHWAAQGAEWLHVVNLDGALGATQSQINALYRSPNILIQHPGTDKPTSPQSEMLQQLPINLQRLREIRQAVTVPIQFGGGLRTLEDIRLALELGADRVVLGTAAIENPDLVSKALEKWGAQRIVVGLDARQGKVAIHGWQTTSGVDVAELSHRMHAMGVERVIYTDIERDGLLGGVNVEATARLGDMTDLQVIASGGVASLQDIEQLKAHEHYNIEGVIVGQALYTGHLHLTQAINVGHQPLTRRSAGIVPYRHGIHGPEFLLIFNLFFEQWQFPRGGVHKGETDRHCALREFSEETGLPVEHFHEDCQVVLTYTAQIRHYEIERTIVYYLAQVGSSEIRLGHENHCEARWQNAQETWELLTETSPEQLPALDAALAYLNK